MSLKAQLQADTGYIEQIDIDEMSELVGDLQADKKYYQANIALATSVGSGIGVSIDVDIIGNQMRGN
jgi:flagellar basal body rod protein FlgC